MKFRIRDTNTKVRRGDRFKVIANKGLNGAKLGDILIAESNSNTGKFIAISISNNVPNEVTLGLHVERLGMTLEGLKERRKELDKDIEDVDQRIAFMESKSLDELDERRYMTFIMLAEINKNSPAEDKEEVINDLIERVSDGLFIT
jgi:hypothetical protein